MITLVGFGKAGNLHFQKYAELGLNVKAVVDPVVERLRPIENRVDVIAESVKELPWDFSDADIVDVCVPHYCLRDILQSLIDRECKKLILEKPVALNYKVYAGIFRFLEKNRVICGVNENYYYSETLSRVCRILEEYGVAPSHIHINFSKDRVPDILAGRYVDSILGIEVPHQIAILRKILGKLHPERVRVAFTDLNVKNGKDIYLMKQMGAFKAEMVSGNAIISLESSMHSKLERVLDMDCGDLRIVADFPHGRQNTKTGRILVSNNGKILHKYTICDDMLMHSLTSIVSCLYDNRPPQTDIQYMSEAVKLIEQLNKEGTQRHNLFATGIPLLTTLDQCRNTAVPELRNDSG